MHRVNIFDDLRVVDNFQYFSFVAELLNIYLIAFLALSLSLLRSIALSA